MRALAIVHQRDAGPGVFGDAFRDRRIPLDEWHIAEAPDPPADPAAYEAVLSFGGAMHADQEDAHPWLAEEKALLARLLDAGTPIFGVCLGAQLLGEAAGAAARRSTVPEIGWFGVSVTASGADDPILGPLAPEFEAFGWHSYEVPLPPGATPLAGSETCLQAFRVGDHAWGIQFHAEVSASDAEHWIRHYDTDPDAIAAGIDPEALWSETQPRLKAWNTLGREMSQRFIETITPHQRGSDPR
jgi:GMP synthase (glutamine-hydrolysing)